MFTKKIIFKFTTNTSERVDMFGGTCGTFGATNSAGANIGYMLHLTGSQALDLILATDFTIPCNEWHNERRSG